MDASNCFVNVINHKSHMIDVEVGGPEDSFGYLEKADVEPTAVAKDAPSVTSLLDIDSEQSGIKIDRPVEIADGKVDVIDAARVDGPRRRFLLAPLECLC